jgi:phosphatidylserine/phosphatidylglycerophosphate/cardiolipin synthase-like enzyme
MKPEYSITEYSYLLAASLPEATIGAVADAVLNAPDSSLRSEISKRVPHHQHRDMVLSFIDRWKREAAHIDSKVVATALEMAAYAESRNRESESIEIVWTGPNASKLPFRHTEQAILEIIQTAKRQIILVSFAVYKIPNVGVALVQAVRRGVELTVIVETPDKLDGENEYNTIRALGDDIALHSSIYYWPRENRQVGDNGKPGLLHVKCIVADSRTMMLSSANLTRQAFTVNMELGVLIRGGEAPAQVEHKFIDLIKNEQLQKWMPR